MKPKVWNWRRDYRNDISPNDGCPIRRLIFWMRREHWRRYDVRRIEHPPWWIRNLSRTLCPIGLVFQWDPYKWMNVNVSKNCKNKCRDEFSDKTGQCKPWLERFDDRERVCEILNVPRHPFCSVGQLELVKQNSVNLGRHILWIGEKSNSNRHV
jgi:hypothetical protein